MAITVPAHADTDLYDVQSDGGSNTTLTFDVPSSAWDLVFYFDANLAGPTDVSLKWQSPNDAFNGLVGVGEASLCVDTNAGILKGTGTTAPASGDTISTVHARAAYKFSDASSAGDWTAFTTLSTPSGGWTWAKLQALHVDLGANLSGTNDTIKIAVSDGGEALGTILDADSGAYNFNVHRVEIIVNIADSPNHLLILATGDDNDVTWTPPTDFAEWFELNGASGDDASIGAWYAQASDVSASTVALVRSGGEELSGVLMVVEGADDLDFRDVVTPLTVETANVDGSPNITPEAITTLTDGALVLIMTGNRSDSGIADTYMPDTEYTWVSQAVSGYTIPDKATTAADPGTAAEGAPGRVFSGLGNGDAQLLWMYKTIASAGTETPGEITNITGGRDHKTATLAIRAKPTLTQAAFRFRNDDGSETTATWMEALNADTTLDAADSDVAFRLRFLIQNTVGVSVYDPTEWQLQFSLNGGAWTAADTSEAIESGNSLNFSPGDPTTQQLGSGTFSIGEIGKYASCRNIEGGIVSGGETEHEFSLNANAAIVSDGDTIDLRLIRTRTSGALESAFTTYTQIPRITIGSTGPAEQFITPALKQDLLTAYDPTNLVRGVVNVDPALYQSLATAYDPIGLTRYLDPAIHQQVATAYNPTNLARGPVYIDPAIHQQPLTAYDPTMTWEEFIETTLYQSLVTAYDPTVVQTYPEQFITTVLYQQLTTAYDPTNLVRGVVFIDPTLFQQLLSAYDPTDLVRGPVYIDPSLHQQLVAAYDPTLVTGPTYLDLVLYQQLMTPYDPEVKGAQVFTVELMQSLATTYDPTFTWQEFITPALLQELITAFDPTINRFISTALVQQLAASYDPQINLNVHPAIHQQLMASYDPVTMQVSIHPALVQQLASAHDPVMVTSYYMTLAIYQQIAMAYDPSVISEQLLDPGFVQSLITAYNILVGAGISTDLVQQLVTAHDPTLTYTYQLDPSLVQNLAVAFDPSLSPGEVVISPTLVDASATAFDPTFTTSYSVVVDLVNNTAVVYDPVLDQTIPEQFVSPVLEQQLIAVYDPVVQGDTAYIILTTVSNLAQVFGVTIEGGEDDGKMLTMQDRSQ